MKFSRGFLVAVLAVALVTSAAALWNSLRPREIELTFPSEDPAEVAQNRIRIIEQNIETIDVGLPYLEEQMEKAEREGRNHDYLALERDVKRYRAERAELEAQLRLPSPEE